MPEGGPPLALRGPLRGRDYDAVVITQPAFAALPAHPNTDATWLAKRIELLDHRADHGITFEQLGVD